ncbi:MULTISPECIES: GNAT family N-acetyltransferase [Pseudomonas]|uniref:GNAT family N-acetyltransferase n=1 Tax=Pseudomonas TaxID=286 RepID=UPI0003B3A56E|nr:MULTISPECIES: GNAT family N-acetyltransferase [Pseudomonas]AZC19624.1 acetyltransferase, GNAT family [Pseudomonas sp. CMR5c]ERO65038.1 GNAT family acetyltransferase [Pseudomonas piscis]
MPSTPPPTIRPAAPPDLAAIERIAKNAYAPYIARLGREPAPMLEDYSCLVLARQVWVLEEQDAIAGFVVLLDAQEALLLDNLAVSPEAQGRGHGRHLLAFAERQALAAGHSCVRLYTNQAMTENIALYGRHGYVETHRAVENGLHRVYMSKPLD